MNVEAIRIKGWDGKYVVVRMMSGETYHGDLTGYNSLSVELTADGWQSKIIKLLDIEKIESITLTEDDE